MVVFVIAVLLFVVIFFVSVAGRSEVREVLEEAIGDLRAGKSLRADFHK